MKIKEYLALHKMTFGQLAEKLDIHYNHLWMISKGTRRPSRALAQEIEKVTNGEITINEVLGPIRERVKCPLCGRKK